MSVYIKYIHVHIIHEYIRIYDCILLVKAAALFLSRISGGAAWIKASSLYNILHTLPVYIIVIYVAKVYVRHYVCMYFSG